jgi:hypothetical protein
MDGWIFRRLSFVQFLSEYGGEDFSSNENLKMEVRNGGKHINSGWQSY